MRRILLVTMPFAIALSVTSCCTNHHKAQGAPAVVPTTEVTAVSSGIETSKEAEIPLYKEEMVVGKKEVSNGGVLIRTTVKTEEVSQPIELQREEYVIERIPAGQAVDKSTVTAFQGREIYIPLTREEPVATKRTWLTEKVQLGKRVEIDHQTVSTPVRSEDVEITKTAGKASGNIWAEAAPVAAASSEPNALHLAKEEIVVGKTQVENGGVNVKKIVHSQVASQPIELQREEYTLNRSPLTEQKLAPADFTQREARLNLTREEPVVGTRILPTEVVRVRKQIETDKQVVTGKIRSEGIEVVKLTPNAAMGGTGTAGQAGVTTISDSESPVTLEGKAVCAKCQLHLTEDCQTVIQTEKDGKKVNYYVVKNEVTKNFKENLCKESKKVTAMGSVAEVAGKLEFTPTEIKLR